MKLKPLVLPLLLILAACGSLGLVTAQSLDERLSYAYGQHTGALQTIATATDLGELHSSEAKAVLAITDNARLILDSAKLAAGAGDVSTAEGRVVLATNVLREVNTYLRQRGVK